MANFIPSLIKHQPLRLVVPCVVSLAILYLFYGYTVHTNAPNECLLAEPHLVQTEPKPVPVSPYTAVSVLKHSAPQPFFKDNLRSDTYYVTSWATAGFTNMFIGYMNLIYLGFLSDRVPILPPFVPHDHMPWTAGPISFSTIFDLDPVREHLRRPIIEWSDVKQVLPFNASLRHEEAFSNPNFEALGCWSTRSKDDPNPSTTDRVEGLFGLDVSYTRVPDFTRVNPSHDTDPTVKFHWLSATIMPGHPFQPSSSYPLMRASPANETLPPDEHLVCYDGLYYACTGVDDMEWRFSWGPAWRFAGTHLRFSTHLQILANEYLSKALGLPKGTAVPPIVTVHIRRGDFANQCWDGKPCLIPLEKFAEAVTDIQRRLLEERKMEVVAVLVASDETDQEFWREIDRLGWKYIDHEAEQTSERLGLWYPPLIDTAALSLGVGFVGTDSSTFSTLSAQRVTDWNQGMFTLVSRTN